MSNKPTLNEEYNNLLIQWGKMGFSSNPKCEECNSDLTGKEVFETPTEWLCAKCFYGEKKVHLPIYKEDFEANRYKEVK